MAIASMDQLITALGAGQRIPINKANVTAVAGRTLSLWSAAGIPGTGDVTTGQAAAGAVPTNSTTGSVQFTNPGSGNSYVGQISGISAATGLLYLYDMLWAWTSGGSGWVVTTTTAQNTTSPVALTRPDANGVNTELWMETLALGGVASGTSTVSYTNTAGTSAHSATLLSGAPISAPPIGTMQPYGLVSGDLGVKTVQSITNSATWTTGTFRLLILRRICEVPVVANVGFNYNAFDLGFPQIYNSACLGMAFNANSTVTGPLSCSLTIAQG